MMGYVGCPRCKRHFDACICAARDALTTANAPGPVVLRHDIERRGHVDERDNGEPERQGSSDRAMWDFVKSKPPPSARGSVTVRRPDGTTITCDVAQLQEVLEQVHKVRPRTIEVTCTAPATTASGIDGQVLGFGPGIGEV
jgi:hypothetical protein